MEKNMHIFQLTSKSLQLNMDIIFICNISYFYKSD